MATRAPKSAARPRTGTSRPRSASTGSTGSSGRAKTSGGTKKTSARSGRGTASPYTRSSGRPRSGTRARRGTARRPPPPPNPLMILLGWLVAALGGIWMALAATVGTLARAFGSSARDLDPAHQPRRRRGCWPCARPFVTAAAIWWHLGVIGNPLTAVMLGTFGSGAWTVPILLLLLAIRFLRHPDGNADTGRMVIGWTALLVGALGLIHIASGTPGPADGGAAMRSAGGLIGYLASAPLVHLVTKWAAVPVLAAVAGLRPAGHHRHAAAPGAGPAGRAARVRVRAGACRKMATPRARPAPMVSRSPGVS